MGERRPEKLCVLMANGSGHLLELATELVEALGHRIVTPWLEGGDVAAVIASARPDVALVGIGDDPALGLALIEEIVHADACPVIALTDSPDPDALREASKRGIFAFITGRDGKDWQSAIDIGLRRFSDYRQLEAAFGRRALIERAKGILMERHSVGEAAAFAMLRSHSRAANRRLIDVAGAVVHGHALLPGIDAAATRRSTSPSVPAHTVPVGA